jgi:alkylhydroperoxidase family enzyme
MSRLPPVAPPYSEEVLASFEKLMPKGMEPLHLFRVLAHNPRVLRRIQRGGLLDPGAISLRHRELVILRTCALTGASYEWDVHVKLFAAAAALSSDDLEAARTEGSRASRWNEEERLVLRATETLHATNTLDDALYRELAAVFTPAARVETVVLAGLYHAISYVVNAFEVPGEARLG